MPLSTPRTATGRRGSRRWPQSTAVLVLLALGLVGSVAGQEREQRDEGEPGADGRVFEHLLVTGGPEHVADVPGSAQYIETAELEEQHYADIHRVLATVPGINIQEEEGHGLRPNIGIRGTGVERSQKVTLLEDGVLIAPAPYSAPAAYYFPTAGRMEAMEVRKGSSAIAEGPFTTGGAINLVSKGIPSQFAARMRIAAGSNETRRAQASIGGSNDRLGWLLETYQFETDGFKKLDGGGATGVDLEDYLGKLRWNSTSGESANASGYHALELKLGRTEQDGQETYLGLTREDFDRSPFRRYAASREDVLRTEHKQYQSRYFFQSNGGLSLTATAYRNDFFRNWHKLQSVAGVGIASVLEEPSRYPGELAVLTGDVDAVEGELAIRNNRRSYRAQGLDVRGSWTLPTSRDGAHQLEFGLRRHGDEEDRFQEEDLWSMRDGNPALFAMGRPGSQSNLVNSADSWAGFVRLETHVGRWTLSPGARYESINFERIDYGHEDPRRQSESLTRQENSVDELLPGFGVSYRAGEKWRLFGGVHKGFAPPGPGQSASTKSEESLNYELGANFGGREVETRLVFFASDYDNLLGRDTLSVGAEGTGDAFNGGEVAVSGVEASFRADPASRWGWSFSTPIRVAYTYTEGEFESTFESSFADWAPEVHAGDKLPYLPEHQGSVSLGWVGKRSGLHLTATYRNEMRSQPGRGAIPEDTGIDESVLFDLSVELALSGRVRGSIQVRNLGDELYLVALRPAGARPGLPRTLLLALDWSH